MEASEGNNGLEDMVWMPADGCFEMEEVDSLNVVQVIGMMCAVDDEMVGNKPMDIAQMKRIWEDAEDTG